MDDIGGYTKHMEQPFEIEKKFSFDKDDLPRITEGLTYVGEKTLTDVFYDTSDYSLTREIKYLRNRNGVFELKIPQDDDLAESDRKVDNYEEVIDEDEIRATLDIVSKTSLEEDLTDSGYIPFATITTTRKKYKSDDIGLDLDEMDFGYRIGEIEVLVANQSEMDSAVETIMAFASERGIVIHPVRGKVFEYIAQYLPELFSELQKEGVM